MKIARYWLAWCCAGCLGVPGMALAQEAEIKALDALQTLSYKDNARMLKELQAKAQAFESSPFPEVRRTYLNTLIGAEFDAGHTDQIRVAIDKLLALSKAQHDDIGMVLANTASAHLLGSAGETEEAFALLKEVEPMALRTGDPEALWIFHLVQAGLQARAGRFEPALGNVLKSMEFARRRPTQAQVSVLRAQVHLGLIYLYMKNPKEALKAIDEAQVIAQSLGASQILGTLHLNRGFVASSMGQQDAALQAYQAALKVGNESALAGLQAAALNNTGDIYLIRKDYLSAEPIERRALAKYQEAGDFAGAALSRANMGFAMMGQGRMAEGVAEVTAGLKFLEASGAKTMEEIILEELSRMYEQAGMFREAVETVRAQQALSRDLFRADREKTVAALQAQYDSVQRERQIEALAHENSLKDAEINNRRLLQTATIIGATLTVMAGGFIFALYRRARLANRGLHHANFLTGEALREKNLFLATASHDLRQPVHAMSMMVEALSLRNHDPAMVPLFVDLKSSMSTMSELLNSLLDLSRLEAGSVKARSVPVALAPLVRGVATMFREQASMGGLEIRLRIPERLAVVLADPVLLRQALVNLVHNAIRYTERGQVMISIRQRGDHWLVEVWDTGIGIAAGEDQKVFSPYYRSEGAWRADSAGHGLGLAVVERCARLMGASYGFKSRLGKGSRFWLQMAATDAPPDVATADTERLTRPDAGALEPLAGRCLVLDDDFHVIAAWKAMLEGQGIDARFATDGAEAVRHVEQGFIPDAIFCDQRLRFGESGFDVLRELLSRCPGASGAMVSGELHSDELEQAEAEGYLVLRKPLDLVALQALLQSWLGSKAPAPLDA
ncbi:MAG: hybrid sensor histidine kinase/response regulator [Ramlibacter sp.]|nr:hybrid sensor histidine kinase/response regulator [Ramlibacter sp.]